MAASDFRRFRSDKTPIIREERKFSNPAVRFVRIRGRVVPIVNKKRIGQLTNRASNKALGAGALLTAAGLSAKKAKSIFKRAGFGFTGGGVINKFLSSAPKLPPAKTLTGKSLRALGRGTAKVAKIPLKKPTKVGLALLGVGALGRLVGSEIEARSDLGFDILTEKE